MYTNRCKYIFLGKDKVIVTEVAKVPRTPEMLQTTYNG